MKKLIGVIIDGMDGGYQRNMTEHLIRAAMGSDVRMLFFGGSAIEAPEANRMNNRSIFGLVDETVLDGLIIVPSTLIHLIEKTDISKLLTRLKHIPIISISMKIKGTHTITIDNKYATRSIFEHMISHYPLEDICYISGPLNNQEAEIRYKVWLELLDEEGVTYDPRRHYEGDFFTSEGGKAVDQFIKDLGGAPKAIVAANDEMAIGAYIRLAQLGYRVPEDVGIAGFDNLESTSDFFPPITTYDQRFDTICCEALKAIEAIANNEMTPGYHITHGELVVRESCGCSCMHCTANDDGENLINKALGEVTQLTQEVQASMIGLLSQKIKEKLFSSDNHLIEIETYSQELFNAFLSDLKEESKDNVFAKTLNSLLNFSIANEGKNSNPLEFFEEIKVFIKGLIVNTELRDRIDRIINAANNVVNVGLRRREASYHYNFRRMYLMSRSVAREFSTAMSIEDIYRILETSLPYYGISYSYMVIYKRPLEFDGIGSFTYPRISELVFSYDQGVDLKRQSFVTKNMLPTQTIYHDDQSNLLFLSLDAGGCQYGYIVFSTDGIDFTIYETIRSHISETMKRHQMNMKRLEAEVALNNVLHELEISNDLLRHQSIHDEMTGLLNRRGFYGDAELYFQEALDKAEPFGLIFGDIDGLKGINDTYGHDEGDFTIKYVAKVLEEVLGEVAVVARMSGDEFTALIKNVKEASLIDVYMTQVNKRLDDFNKMPTKPYQLSISMGYVPYDYKVSQSMDALLLGADKKMYRAKNRKKQAGN